MLIPRIFLQLLGVLGSFFIAFSPLNGANDIILSGSGATFPYPLYNLWVEQYTKSNSVRITYRPTGSGQGIREFLERETDFAGSDVFLAETEIDSLESVIHIPTCLGAVVLVTNLPDSPQLQLTPAIIEGIFLGEISNWNDRRIRRMNPDVRFPDLDIEVVHRSDGSGTTFVFTDYLSKVSHVWKEQIGAGKKVRWPTGMGISGNSGVAYLVGKIPGAIGYVSLNFASEEGIVPAKIRNRHGEFIEPTVESVQSAARIELPAHMRVLLTDTSAPAGYPISTFSYIMVYREQAYGRRDIQKARTLSDFLWWIVHAGQLRNAELLYGPLPPEAVRKAEQAIHSLKFNDQPIRTKAQTPSQTEN